MAQYDIIETLVNALKNLITTSNAWLQGINTDTTSIDTTLDNVVAGTEKFYVITQGTSSSVDSGAIDAFGRQRMSQPETLFESKLLHDDLPLVYDDSQVSGSGTTSTHSTDKAAVTMSVSATTAGKRIRQSFRRMNYQPGKSQLAIFTGVLGNPVTGIEKRFGLFDDNDGLFLSAENGAINLGLRSSVTGSVVDTLIPQASWNIDTLDGNGASGVNLDFTKAKIFIIDFEWLGVGSVRFGFVSDNAIYYCHKIDHTNSLTDGVYMSTPNLPVRYEIENTGTGAADSIYQICTTVISEGGTQDAGTTGHISTGGPHVSCSSADTLYAIVGMRLKSTHLDSAVKLLGVSLLGQANNDPFEWIVMLDPTIAGTFTYGNLANSPIQFATGATTNTVTGGTAIFGGFSWSREQLVLPVNQVIALGSAIDGTPNEIVLCARPLTPNQDIHGSMSLRFFD